ncbi:molybdopterin synthase catalytic subunit MoaE [Haliea sp. E1-2-M8]|uniref:molybdopterin synthase catalytic subunit MoaE n=1 Tax=Haliea sp. E1-2-M8 TaxID=3064706 RepID=UPI0027211448|nr:molybdopterin synthase catalytic subunit MoaE [Haliea sp. E1-2-M8]MDO8861898.1 molybdopterin synthase catalytic subunit MoaE [Haliea sp. E1-2-M8]
MATAALTVQVQEQAFDPGALQQALASADSGAVVTFTGHVRGGAGAAAVTCLELEHYPGMTERSLLAILEDAAARWPLLAAAVVHRVGRLGPGEPIVWVGVSAAHRGEAFAACDFIMDFLKTRAPFWKKEHGPAGAAWVESRGSDEERAARWQPSTDGAG